MNRRSIWVTASTAARRVTAERSGIAVSLGFYIVVMSVLASLWRAAAESNGGTIAGYSAVALTWYAATTEAATLALPSRLISDIGDDIGSGAVASELLRPASVLAVRVVSELGRALPRLGALCVAGLVLATITVGPPPHLLGLLLAAPSLVLATACNLVAQHAFAGIAFWLRSAGSTWFLYQKLVFLVGGMLIPLEVLPAWLHRAALALPFQAMAYAPARLASGHVEPILLAQQVGWLGALILVAVVVFRSGEQRLQVVGG